MCDDNVAICEDTYYWEVLPFVNDINFAPYGGPTEYCLSYLKSPVFEIFKITILELFSNIFKVYNYGNTVPKLKF